MVHGEALQTVDVELGGADRIISTAPAVWMSENIDITQAEREIVYAQGGKQRRERELFWEYGCKSVGFITLAGSGPGRLFALQLGQEYSLVYARTSLLACDAKVTLRGELHPQTSRALRKADYRLDGVSGPGFVCFSVQGNPTQYRLETEQSVRVRLQNLAFFEKTASYEIIEAASQKSSGQDDLLWIVLRGPGKIWLHGIDYPFMH